MYDIIVVGGNLSGASAAINAAEKGVKVVLIERNKEPFNPAHCGEAIGDITGQLINLVNLNCKVNEISTTIINVGSKKEYRFKLSRNKILIIDRNCVEKKLLKKAKELGVELKLGCNMIDFNSPNEVVLQNEKIKGKVIIDASGIACKLGSYVALEKKLKPEDVGICIQSRVKSNFKEDEMKMWFHKPYAPFGYAWLFPLNDEYANIGIGIPGGQKLDLKTLLNKYIDYEANEKYKIISTFRSCVPSAKPLNSLIVDNVMFVGDAGRLTGSALGSGIGNALFSGSLAGRIASKYILGELSDLEVYQDILHHKIKSLNKTYKKKSKLINDRIFIARYRRAWSILCFANKILPNFLQGQVAKILEKDIKILSKY